jgi:hypothetical protein
MKDDQDIKRLSRLGFLPHGILSATIGPPRLPRQYSAEHTPRPCT